jgi:hypothetical protein
LDKGILKRLSIVLTVLFIVGFTAGTALTEIGEHAAATERGFTDCINLESRSTTAGADISRCYRMMELAYDAFDRGAVWKEAFFAALILAAIIWLLIALVHGVTRWVLNGRTEQRGA